MLPGTYQRYVATVLGNLALFQGELGETEQAQSEIDEAIDIGRILYRADHQTNGDALARSLILGAQLLARSKKGDWARVCSLVHEGVDAAFDPRVKESAKDLVAKCQ